MGKLLNDWLEAKIAAEGLSISGLATRMGISQSYLSAVLSGSKKPGAKFYQGVARAFGLPLDAVERLDRAGQQPEDSNSEDLLRDLLDLAQRLPDGERRLLLDFAIFLLWRKNQISVKQNHVTAQNIINSIIEQTIGDDEELKNPKL